MLSDTDIVQMNSGTGTTVTFQGNAPTTAGNRLFIFATIGGGTWNTPSGFTRDAPTSAAGVTPVWSKPTVDSETSWTLSAAVSGPIAWKVIEHAGLDTGVWVDVAVATGASSLTSASTAVTSSYDAVAYAVHSAYNSTGGVAATLGSHTNGFEEIAPQQSATDGTKACVLSVSRKYLQSIGAQQCTATASGTTPTSSVSHVVVFTAQGARRAADVHCCMGFELGSTSGLTASGNGQPYVNAAPNATVEAAAARTGGYGCRIQSSAAAGYVNLSNSGIMTGVFRAVVRMSFRFRSALPGGDVTIAEFGGFLLRYRTATQKLGLQYTGGTEVLSDAAVSSGQWFSVDFDIDVTVSQYTADWQVTYSDGQTPVAQTRALSPTGQTPNLAPVGVLAGSSTAQTLTMDVDDIVVSKTRGHYPLGDMRIYPLKVDPAGTPSVSGTSTNFQTFTSNGTGTAWNATTARGAVDDIPPTIGASADGVMQVTAAASDYVAFPLETLDLASIPGSIRGVRACVAGWAASGTAAAMGLFAYDGTTEYTLAGLDGTTGGSDPGWDNAAELWVCVVVKPTSGRILWDQAKLDALVFRMGKSSDATPDIGIHAFVFEAVVRKTEPEHVFGQPGGLPRVEEDRDPDSQGITRLRVYTDTGQTGTLTWYDSAGTPTNEAIPAASNPHLIPINAIDVPYVPRVELVID